MRMVMPVTQRGLKTTARNFHVSWLDPIFNTL